MKKIIAILLSIFISVLFGSFVSMAVGVPPMYAIGGAVILSNVIMPAVTTHLPNGVLNAVVLKSAYEAELLKSLKEIKNDFLARVRDRSELVGNDVLDLTKAGVKPNVLIDNTAYPIPAVQRTDEGVKLPLRKLTTEVTIITEDELYALPYDKKNDVIADHKIALQEEFRKLALYSFCPAAQTSKTPVIVTTGADDGTGRRRLTKADLIKLRSALNGIGVGECDLVLSPEHVEDILLWSEVFERQYQLISSGIVLPMYGFMISQNQGYAPLFNGTTKTAYGAVAAGSEVSASVAYPALRMIKGYGSLKMYFKEPEPRYQQSEVNFNAHFIAIPKDSEGTAAIVSGKV